MVLQWGNKEIFKSAVGIPSDVPESGLRYYWKDQGTSIALSSSNETLNTKLKISLYDAEIYGQGEFLGFVYLDFVSLLALNDGIFEYKLRPTDLSQRYVKGSVTFRLGFHIPMWDSISMKFASSMRRRIGIVRCYGLPEVNGASPNTKCVVSINGIPEITSDIIDSSTSPVFPLFTVDVFLENPVHEIEVIVFVYHVDYQRKKDICIGQASVPFEMILHPMKSLWTVALATPMKTPPKRYTLFLPSGFIKVDVQVINVIDDSLRQSFVSRELQMHGGCSCENLYPSRDRTKKDISIPELTRDCTELLGGIECQGGTLRNDELACFGTVIELNTVQELCMKRKWILIPICNVCVNIGNDSFQWALGSRYVIAVERDMIRIGDISMVQNFYQDIQHTINSLRKKDLVSQLRDLSFKELKTTVSDMTVNALDRKRLLEITANSITLCLPGCRVFIGSEKHNFVAIDLYENFRR